MADIINFAEYYFSGVFDFTPALKYSRSRAVEEYVSKPERQGSLDSLCGVYCVINAVSHVAKLSQQQRKELFKLLIKFLHKRSNISKCLRHGTSEKQLLFMLKTAQGYLVHKYNIRLRTAPLFKKNVRMGVKEYLAFINNSLNRKNAIVIIDINGIHQHWTCITSITPKTIQLLDSDGLNHLKIATCRISNKPKAKYHYMRPDRTWWVWLESKKEIL